MRGFICLLILLFTTFSLYAQKHIGIGITAPENSTKMDVLSTTQGMVIPRMTALQSKAIVIPATGCWYMTPIKTPHTFTREKYSF